MHNLRRFLILALTILLAACSLAPQSGDPENPANPPDAPSLTTPVPPTKDLSSAPTEPAEAGSSPTGEAPIEPFQISAEYPDGENLAMTIGEDGTLYMVVGMKNSLFLVKSADRAATFTAPLRVNPDAPANTAATSRPSIQVDSTGRVLLAWNQLFPNNSQIAWMAVSENGGGSFGPELALSERLPRLYMPSVTPGGAAGALLSWLQDGALILADVEPTSGAVEQLVLDDAVCDCCQPFPVWVDGTAVIAYRNLEQNSEGQDIRDIYVVQADPAAGTVATPVRVSDAPWFLNACPVSGPALAAAGNQLLVAWMDGRNDQPNMLNRSDIWFASSDNGGESFSSNLRVNAGGDSYNAFPSLAVDGDGGIHLAWYADEGDRAVVYYAGSTDGGITFSQPEMVIENLPGSGNGRIFNVALSVTSDGQVFIAWVDRGGIHLATR